jgi:hypothetical protein
MHLFALEFGLPVHAKRTSTRIVPVESNLPVLANLATLCKWNLVNYPPMQWALLQQLNTKPPQSAGFPRRSESNPQKYADTGPRNPHVIDGSDEVLRPSA